ncbi:MAG: response regulator, partial [Synergistaceae bacterium]|nr:response regulator [Synergistaceae bacterium]
IVWRILTLRRALRRRTTYRWYHRYADALFVAATGLVLTFSILLVSSEVERSTREDTFHMLADSESGKLHNSLKSIRDIGVEGAAAFFSYSDFVDFEEFKGYARHLEELPEVRGATWLPFVPHEEREAFERLGRSLVTEDFVIRDYGEGGKRVPAPERPFYYPVLYRIPFEGSERILGADFAQVPSRKLAIDEAHSSRLPAATEAIPLLAAPGTLKGIVVFQPVYFRNDTNKFMGVLGMVVELNALLNRMRTEEAHVERAVLVGDLWRLYGAGVHEHVVSTGEYAILPPAWPAVGDLFSVRPLLFFGRTFAVILRPGPGFRALYPPRAGWMSLFAGIMVTAVLTMLAVTVANRREELERQVAMRTDELRRSKDELFLMNAALVDTTRKTQEIARRAEAASEAKGRFLANMSHEMRTPLNGFLGMNRLLLDTRLTEEQREYAVAAQKSGEALLTLISDALDIATIDEGRYRLVEEDFDLDELLSKLETIFSAAAHEKGLRFTSVRPSVPLRLHGDGRCLYRILRSLLDNAVKFTVRGEVRFSVSALEESDRTVRLRFSVEDTGVGIPSEQQGCVFERFWQGDDSTTKSYQGAGLGLPMAKELAALLGGELEMQSEEGRGTTFSFESLFHKGASPAAPSIQDESVTGRRILLAEDNPVNRKFALAMLRKLGYSVASAENGKEAVDYLSSNECDLVVMDVQMPVMDGVEATRMIRSGASGALDPSIPVVALTAYVSPEDRERCMVAGMNAFLPKPAAPEELDAAIRRLLYGEAGGERAETHVPAEYAGKAAPVFDRAAALKRLMGDEDALAELAEEFIEEMPKDLEKFSALVSEGDAAAAGRCAHSIKGAAAGIGGEALRAAAFEAEKAGKAGDANALLKLEPEVREQYELLEAALRQLISSRGGKNE